MLSMTTVCTYFYIIVNQKTANLEESCRDNTSLGIMEVIYAKFYNILYQRVMKGIASIFLNNPHIINKSILH
jgi:hypothetical protein